VGGLCGSPTTGEQMNIEDFDLRTDDNTNQKPKTIIRTGQRFICCPAYESCRWNDSEEYILAIPVALKVCLISLKDGNRWCNPVSVRDTQKLSQTEISSIFGDLNEWERAED
jgi:hypothetical protein